MNPIDLTRVDLNLLATFEVLMEERSVSRAAARMCLTQSALSHALSRLRELTGDPLLVKSGSGMAASPYATALAERMRPILRSIERVLQPPEAFAPATSQRVFRLAMPDMAMAVFPRLLSRVWAEGPQLGVEWAAAGASTLLEVAEGLLDAAIIPSFLPLPEGVAHLPLLDIAWACFMRDGHPAAARWSARAWSSWPHVIVRVGHRRDRNPLQEQLAAAGLHRTVSAWVPQFSAIAPLLAASDHIATLPQLAMLDAIPSGGVIQRPAPIALQPMPHRMVWSASRDAEPASKWFRALLRQAFDGAVESGGRVGTRRSRTSSRTTPRS